MKIFSRAPARIDFAGGFTDLIPFTEVETGYVVNAAISLYSHAEIVESNRHNSDGYIEVSLQDVNERLVFAKPQDFTFDGHADLVKAAIIRTHTLSRSFSLSTSSNIPLGGGLGSSAAFGVSIAGALEALSKKTLAPEHVADTANFCERDMGIAAGKQDHYTSVLGGINALEFSGESVQVKPIRVSSDIRLELERRLVLCYTEKSRLAGYILNEVVATVGDPKTNQALCNLRIIAKEMPSVLVDQDLQAFGELLLDNWYWQKQLHPAISTPDINTLFEIALRAGAIGGKACGAGGGGCIVFLSDEGGEYSLRRKLQDEGVQILNWELDLEGLKVRSGGLDVYGTRAVNKDSWRR